MAVRSGLRGLWSHCGGGGRSLLTTKSSSFGVVNSVRERNMSSPVRKLINTASAPAAIGPYSQAVVVDRTMYISGQLGLDVASGQLVPGGVQAQAKQALINMGEILKAAGSDYGNVVKTTVLLADINDFNSVNDVYKTFFTSNFPARAAYQVAALPRGGLVEIEAVAVIGAISDS
ncbi:2-iminobutanoate/2-iminopropanoate deaminase isoform X1 [Lampris incognitus]|uniref:2-iminobutanoate/2-iminopropanoate deaminase isoform X1 n=1 Tax=Lampris incognitus TaxID=2546036 RepID=UPI0024B50F5A|nr:2-iminobutanoate/2-iminopropanoate deaminase isoform X1 [Lampris incognitus]